MVIAKHSLGNLGISIVVNELQRQGHISLEVVPGLRKRREILVRTKRKGSLRIETGSMQKGVWPNCKGIYDKDAFLVLVDFENKTETDRPDFYILAPGDWLALIKTELKHNCRVAEFLS